MLRGKLGKGRVSLKDDLRCRLAVKAKALGRRVLRELSTIVTPDTLLRWHRKFVARKRDFSALRKRVGRPPTPEEIAKLAVQRAPGNPGLAVSDTTLGTILREHGSELALERQGTTRWTAFPKAHWDVPAAVDFMTGCGVLAICVLLVAAIAVARWLPSWAGLPVVAVPLVLLLAWCAWNWYRARQR